MFSNINANELTIVVGLVGLLASAALSYLFYALGRRSEQAELSNQISTLQSALLTSLGEASAKYRSESAGRQPAASVIAADQPGQARVLKPAPQAESLRADPEVTELVRGYLALLVNHKGEVEMSALLRQVSEALGARRGLIGSALTQLAAQNVISAEPGQDIVNARTIYLRPPLSPGDRQQ